MESLFHALLFSSLTYLLVYCVSGKGILKWANLLVLICWFQLNLHGVACAVAHYEELGVTATTKHVLTQIVEIHQAPINIFFQGTG